MSKKKIAVLVGGEYRYLDIAIKSWKPIIDYGCDFYVSTWDISKPTDKYSILQNNNIVITKNMITDLIPTAIVSLLDNSERELLHNISMHNTIKQLYHWKNLIKIMDDKVYDILIVTRPDIFLNNALFNFNILFDTITNDKLYSTTFIPSTKVREFANNVFNDCFFLGYQSVVKEFINKIDIENKDAHKTHSYLTDVCQSIGIGVQSITNNFGPESNLFAIVRPTIEDVNPNHYNFQGIKTAHDYSNIINKTISNKII
jgi:hypothetical protein